jgi:histidinol-phosphate/aromatic aminotransferase/cobyric acid decarboxylase-like protein
MKRPEALASYQWPPSNEVIAERVGLDPSAIIRFDGNVAATPPASARPAALARALADVNEYDRGRYFSLRSAIAERHDVGVDQVALGAGSDEFIVLLARLFADGGTVATVPEFSYSMYPFAAAMAGASIVKDPTKADLVFVCRPNNPTGELPEIPDVPGQLVIDEAYADYAGVDALDRVDHGRDRVANVLQGLRTGRRSRRLRHRLSQNSSTSSRRVRRRCRCRRSRRRWRSRRSRRHSTCRPRWPSANASPLSWRHWVSCP